MILVRISHDCDKTPGFSVNNQWRAEVFNGVAVATSLALFSVAIIVLIRAFVEGRELFTPPISLAIGAFFFTIPLAIIKSYFRLRAAIEVAILIVIGLVVITQIGVSPGSSILLAIAAVLATLFVSFRAGLFTLILIVVSILCVGWVQTGAGFTGEAVTEVSSGIRSWIFNAAILGSLTCVLIVLINHVVNTIEQRTLALAQTIEQLEQTQKALAESKRVESLGRLAAGIAHDFNNTLHVVNSWAEFLEDDPDKDVRKEGVAAIQKASHKASILISKLLTLSRDRIQKPKLTSPKTALSELKTSIGNTLPESIKLESQITSTPSVFVDPDELEQVLLNLVFNARDAMPDGGLLTIGLDVGTNCSKQTGPDKSMVHIFVKDTGIGIEKAILETIFDPFFTTKGEHGTGLGLSTALMFAETAGGSLVADSEPDSGTTVHLYLPVSEAA